MFYLKIFLTALQYENIKQNKIQTGLGQSACIYIKIQIIIKLLNRQQTNQIQKYKLQMKIRQLNTNNSVQSTNSNQDNRHKVPNKHNISKTRMNAQKQNIINNGNVGIGVKNNKGVNKGQSGKKLANNRNIDKINNEKISNQVKQYEKDIMKYLKYKQGEYRISANYLRQHEYITHTNRATYVKHFFKLGKRFNLKRTTIYLATYYMDSYLQKNPQLQKKQTIISALACMFIAMKYQQIYPPELQQWTQATKQIILAQSLVLKCLNFNLTFTTIEHYLQYNFSKVDIAEHDKDMIRLIADVSLFDQSMYTYTQSQLSLAIIYSIVNRNKLQQKMQMSIKWMMQRNQKYMEWLQANKIHKFTTTKI